MAFIFCLVLPFYAGLKDGRIEEGQISASSEHSTAYHKAEDGRLDVVSIMGDGWSPHQSFQGTQKDLYSIVCSGGFYQLCQVCIVCMNTIIIIALETIGRNSIK